MIERPNFKFQPKYINVSSGPVLIVGQNPGRQRLSDWFDTCWTGNKSADLLAEAIEDLDNLILTNVCNYQRISDVRISLGLIDLSAIVSNYRPRLIICLGEFAKTYVDFMEFDVPSVKLYHPSFIVRFGKDKALWISQIRKLVEEYDLHR